MILFLITLLVQFKNCQVYLCVLITVFGAHKSVVRQLQCVLCNSGQEELVHNCRKCSWAQLTELYYFIMKNANFIIVDTIWYHDDKIIKQTKNMRIKIKDDKTSIIIRSCELSDGGSYVCKAVSTIGEVETKAKLTVKSIKLAYKFYIIYRCPKYCLTYSFFVMSF